MQAFWDWLIGEPGAVWITGALLLLAKLIITCLRRERPPRVIIQEIESIRLLNVHPSQRDRLQVSYVNNKGVPLPIEDLRQKEIVIYNDGTRDILESLELALQFLKPGSADAPFEGRWWWFFDENRYSWARTAEQETVAMGSTRIHRSPRIGIAIELPYLNSYPVHGDYVSAHLVSDREIEVALRGRESGKGWSARFVGLDQVAKLQARIGQIARLSVLPMMLLAGGIAGLVLSRWARATGSEIEDPGSLGMLIGAFVGGVVSTSLLGPIGRMLFRKWLGARLPSEFERMGS